MSDSAIPILPVLRRSDVCRGLSAQDLEQVATAVRPLTVPAGTAIFTEDEPGHTMYLVASGQVKLSTNLGGRERVLDYLGRGDPFGDMSVLTGSPRTSTATAVVETRLLELGVDQFNDLLVHVPGFVTNLSRSLVWRLHKESTPTRKRRQPAVVAMVNTSPRTLQLLPRLARGLSECGDHFQVLTDRPERWTPEGNYLVERIPLASTGEDVLGLVHERIHKVLEHRMRAILEVTQQGIDGRLARLLAPCEEIWWLVEPDTMTTSLGNLRKLLVEAPSLAARTHLVWIMRDDGSYAPPRPAGLEVASRDFKVVLGNDPGRGSRLEQHSFQRLVRHLRGTRLGLALGGGGARGLAHLGAIRAFEREGISFDLVAGTSSGALFGLSYVSGWAPDTAIMMYEKALTPNPWWRRLPGGLALYLATQFRTGTWDGMLRPYLHDTTLEQLSIPFSTVAVDLISGTEVVRDTGDVIGAVMESINLPLLASPLIRPGMALVDGGVLNNVPAEILPERGADFVVAIDVVAKLKPRFAGNTPETPLARMRRPSTLSSLLRIVEVQSQSLTNMRSGAVDLLITPDASEFDFTDFSRARELADIGDAAVQEIMPRLKQMLAELEQR